MPRDIPVGNGDLLITFDKLYRVRDIYFPHVGRYNHTEGHVQRFGVWVDGRFAWIEDNGWKRSLKYQEGTLVTEVTLRHEGLGLELRCHDAVDFHEPVYMRRCVVTDLSGKDRDVRLFSHWDLSVRGSPVGDTANYDPASSSLVVYKDDAYFLFNACDENKCGIDNWAIGTKRVRGAEGTWRDAEDGQLGRNAISQGSVDATVGYNLQVPARGSAYVTSWMACGKSHSEVKALNQRVLNTGPDRMIARTAAYWRLWARKDIPGIEKLPERVADLFVRSQLVLRTQIDNGGAIIAANDSDITQFGGDHYSYCWPRDGALVAYSLILTGQSELSRSFFRFCAKCLNGNSYFLHKYTPAAELASSWHPWMVEGQRVLPIQQDETSLVLWALRKHFETFRDVEFIKSLYIPLVVKPADWILSYRDVNGIPHQSWDLWEERRGIHTFTVASTIGALRAAALFATDFGDLDRAQQYREGADRMEVAMKRYLWHPEQKRFARMATPMPNGQYRLDMTSDSANFAIFAIAGISVDDPQMVSEAKAIQERLSVKTGVGGYARYERDYYHQIERDRIDQVPGNPWAICSLWRAQYVIAKARNVEELEEARGLLEWCVYRAEESGVMAEQFHPHTGDPISVSPLTWSHATYVIVVLEYLTKLAQLETAEVDNAVSARSLTDEQDMIVTR
ncbi:glucan 1,3-alpha-glucosidase [Phycisphaerae bacterium]|jgi:GH15 family glucan-1,4-alpha-glucosidase|nr:glucan 1,3-alpha-glucosidase [Phycisphaerae bacterium]